MLRIGCVMRSAFLQLESDSRKDTRWGKPPAED